MDTDLHRRITEIFLSVCDLGPGERGAALDRLCAGDAPLRSKVEAMLAFEAKGTGFLSGSPASGLASVSESMPERLGSFRLVRKLGEGGMGVVFEAEQDRPRRSVALKILRMTFASERMLRRFEYEAELLGQLHHPGIAQIHEAGVEDTGHGPQPYFAMELVRGLPITTYARALALDEQLVLIARVCDAIEHAHRQGIIHRDLKPANILVSEAGDPKVLDFGVARASGPARELTEMTGAGQIIGTLAYMSPEQASATGDEDTRADVYAMGVILYEVIAGRLPHEIAQQSTLEAVRTIQEAEPRPLDPTRRELRGDVATIVAKALEKDREHRYGSAAALAADLRRYLALEPIEARPASQVYRLRKFVRRHRGLSAGLALAALAIVLGLAATSWQAYQKTLAEGDALRQATRAIEAKNQAEKAEHEATLKRADAEQARNEARDAAATAQAINQFLLLNVLQSPDPRVSGRDVRVIDVLDQASAHASEQFAQQPRLEAAVRATLAKSYLALDRLPQAEQHAERSLALYRELGASDDADAVSATATLVEIFTAQNDLERGIPLARATLTRQRAALGEEAAETLITMTNLATLLMNRGEVAEGEPLLRRVIATRERVSGPEHNATLVAKANLAFFWDGMGRHAESRALQQEVYEVRMRVFGKDHPDTLLMRQAIAFARFTRGELTDPEGEFRELTEAMTRVFGERHERTCAPMMSLAHALQRQGKNEDARGWFERAYHGYVDSLGDEHPSTAEARRCLATCLAATGRLEEAMSLAEDDLEIQRRVRPDDEIGLADSMIVMGELLALRGQDDEAESLLRDAQRLYEASRTPSDPRRARARDGLRAIERKRRAKE